MYLLIWTPLNLKIDYWAPLDWASVAIGSMGGTKLVERGLVC